MARAFDQQDDEELVLVRASDLVTLRALLKMRRALEARAADPGLLDIATSFWLNVLHCFWSKVTQYLPQLQDVSDNGHRQVTCPLHAATSPRKVTLCQYHKRPSSPLKSHLPDIVASHKSPKFSPSSSSSAYRDIGRQLRLISVDFSTRRMNNYF